MNIDRSEIEKLVRSIIMEEYSNQINDSSKRHVDSSGIMSISLPLFSVSEEDRLDTGDPNHKVYTKDLVSLAESPRLGCGLMVMEDTTFDWTLGYDEIDYIIEGTLTIIIDGRRITANAGELILIPSGSRIQFSVEGKARFIYVTYPADWQHK
ncbi:Ethanolamine utilization EutQ family protein [[Clostridium] saccharolyticum WM1]|uniref:Ethanolamine utilization EutQ family protein n=1 Tax=Lacrimispora saccharolytica (strain ATCC 35040 / DSM 2544 / NRCC 2533 / WM1) TaxID=610130 RepID=D9R9Q5_LACSW|nr:cupin domain-containing protein [Lacrimispora saccharolytica]ADL04105.1 Ethanolamine utilization EutQ family protein [[Clostridium] saccharolyticum WM1]